MYARKLKTRFEWCRKSNYSNHKIPHFYSGNSMSTENSNMAGKMEGEGKLVNLPLARIKTIMKSSPDMSHAGQESIFMVAKATVSGSLILAVDFLF